MPVFSVDYRLAPRNPYPDPVNDCYQAYVWIMTQAEEQLGMKIKHVILAGDSAGGHLALSVNLLAILRGFRRPDGLLIHYPVCHTDINRFYPSMLMSVDDIMLSLPFRKIFLGCFLRAGGNPDKSPICSPLLAPLALLRLLPPMRIFACEIDSLRDQAF